MNNKISLKLIEGHGESEREFIVEGEYTVESQLGGQISVFVKVNSGFLTLTNGNIADEVSENRPRILYSLIAIEN